MKKIIIILLVSLLFNGCSSKSQSKVVDLKDCSVTFPSDYGVKFHKDNIIDSVLIKPTNLTRSTTGVVERAKCD